MDNGKQRDINIWDEPEDVTGKRDSVDVNIPLLVIGTKQVLILSFPFCSSFLKSIFPQDLAADRSSLPVRQQRRSYIAEEFGTEEIHLNCTDEKSLLPGSSASNKLARFFDKVIERQFYRREQKSSTSGFWDRDSNERRRLI